MKSDMIGSTAVARCASALLGRSQNGCARVRKAGRERIHYLLADALLGIGVIAASAATSIAQETTPNPGAWRPVVYADLKSEKPDNLTYIDIWKDALSANNGAYEAKGAARTPGENAPATDAHVVIRSPERTIVLTTLDTEAGCKRTKLTSSAGVSVKMCPTRLVTFAGPLSKTKDLQASCFLEPDPAISSNPAINGAYAAYDTVTKTIKLGLILDHRAIDECARFISVSQ